MSGAYGFVGTNLSKYLASKGHECIALDVAKGNVDAYSAFYTWDDLDQIDWAHIDAVVHLAGKAHDTKNVTEPQVYFEVNVGLTQKLFTVCGNKVKTFIYFSSIKAVDGDTPYAQSKREAEKWLDGRAVVLEPAMIHGPGNKGNLNLLFAVVKHGIPWPLAAFENRRSFTSGVLTQPPSIKLLISALAEKVSNEPSREDSLMCEALRFPSSEVKPPTWNSATETMSAG